jgi:hypothetical protein
MNDNDDEATLDDHPIVLRTGRRMKEHGTAAPSQEWIE